MRNKLDSLRVIYYNIDMGWQQQVTLVLVCDDCLRIGNYAGATPQEAWRKAREARWRLRKKGVGRMGRQQTYCKRCRRRRHAVICLTY